MKRFAISVLFFVCLSSHGYAQPVNGGGWPSVTPTAASTYTIATGGTAVTAIAASTIAHGFVVRNPTTATEAGCFSITGTATTTAGGGNACLNPGESYEYDGPVSTALSINAATSGHVFTIWYW